MKYVLVIPTFEPTQQLIDTLTDLSKNPATANAAKIVINDGSSKGYEFLNLASTFFNVTLLQHKFNLGKGAAIKTGLAHLNSLQGTDFMITLDSDGQHPATEVEKLIHQINKSPCDLVIGSRDFSVKGIPFRSWFGNQLTRILFFLVYHVRLRDTQSGLRAYKKTTFTSLLGIESNRYEFEMDALVHILRENQSIDQVDVATVYIDGNKSSHFNPMLDSMRIYFVFLRYSLSSFFAATLDAILFFTLVNFGLSFIGSHFISRTLLGTLNFLINKNVVFKYSTSGKSVIVKYFALLYLSGLASFGVMRLIQQNTSIGLTLVKIVAEVTIFFGNFAAQKYFVFRKSRNLQNQSD